MIARGRVHLESALSAADAPRRLRVRAAPPMAFTAEGSLDVPATIANLPASVRAGVTEFDFPMLFVEHAPRAFDALLESLAGIERSIDHYA